MLSEKLISLLKTFSKYELNRLRKFLQSPYFNDQEDVIRLFELINTALRKGESGAALLNKERIWSDLYPKRKMDDAHLRRLSSDLNQLTLRFFVEENRSKDYVHDALELQRALSKPELKKQLESVERQLQRHFEGIQAKSAQTYLAQFNLYLSIFNNASKTVAISDLVDKMLPADHFLESFYIIQKLKFYVNWLMFRGFRSTPVEMQVMPGFWEYINTGKYTEIPLIVIYRNVVLCLTESNEERHFQDLLDNLERFADDLTKEDLRECYQIAQNYCAFKVNQGRTEYNKVMFGLFRQSIRLKILLEDDILQEGIFKNIITISLVVGEYEWAEQFIQEYAGYLPSDIRENARTFNLANLYFFQKKYDRVIELLQNVEYSDVVYALSAKFVLVRTYYETEEFMALDSLIDSFRIFLRRNKLISKTFKTEYNNFLLFVKKLSILPPGNPKAVAQLRGQIERCNAVVTKKWLLEKIDAF
jgi:hypothetical protein